MEARALEFLEREEPELPVLLLAWLAPGVVNSLRDGIVYGSLGGLGLVNVLLWPVLAWGFRRSDPIEGGA